MFRNTYLEAYKNSTLDRQDIQYLLGHFTHLYATLGCVLQDLEFQIGKIVTTNSYQQAKEGGQERNQYSKGGRNKKDNKEIIKIEDSQQVVNEKRRSKQMHEVKEGKPLPPPIIPKQESVSRLRESDKYKVNQIQGIKQNSLNSNLIRQIPRNDFRNIGTSSFDELFEPGGRGPVSNTENINSNRHMDIIVQQSGEESQSQNPNTYEDFFDRVFRQSDSRKRK